MSIDIVPCSSVEELTAALQPIVHYFGGNFTEQDTARWARIIDIPRMHSARENGVIVGGAGAFTFEMTTPGGVVPAAGVTVVGVLPTHRRRGILTGMMRAQLDDVHRRGEPVAYLWASEETIYPRFGYGMAALCGDIELPKTHAAFARRGEPRGTVRLVPHEDALQAFPALYDAVRRHHPGMPSRTRDWWELRRLADTERSRAGGGVLNRALLAVDGKPEAYALYRMHQSMEGGQSVGYLNVIEALGVNPAATRDIWRFLLEIDWIQRVKASLLPVDHPLLHLAARPRAMKFRVIDSLWVRLVDVPKAFAARTVTAGPPVTIEVRDAFCPWNAGTYRVAEGRFEKAPGGSPELVMDVNALGSIYLGGFTMAQLVDSSVVEERSPGAAARFDALLPRGRAPWCPEIF